jgi:hypothetical protein
MIILLSHTYFAALLSANFSGDFAGICRFGGWFWVHFLLGRGGRLRGYELTFSVALISLPEVFERKLFLFV